MYERLADCMEVQSALDAWLTGELEPALSSEISNHLAECPCCSNALIDLQSVQQRLLQEEEQIPLDVNQAMVQFISHLVDERRQNTECLSIRLKTEKRFFSLVFLCILVVTGVILPTELPFAVRLVIIGIALNLCGLFLLPLFLRGWRWRISL